MKTKIQIAPVLVSVVLSVIISSVFTIQISKDTVEDGMEKVTWSSKFRHLS